MLHKKFILQRDELDPYTVHIEEVNGGVHIWNMRKAEHVTLTEHEFLWLLKRGWAMFDNPAANDLAELLTERGEQQP